jgi:hypothetical protein
MSNQSGTVGRARGMSITSNQMRRQRSVEWQNERNYSSSEEENDRIGSRNNNDPNRKNSANAIANVDSSILAQLIAQSQQLASKYQCHPHIKTQINKKMCELKFHNLSKKCDKK